MSGLYEKCCLITGGTRGIGKATIELFAANNARVYTCSRNQSELDELLAECTVKDWSVKGCVCDVSDKESMAQMIENVKASFDGKLHVLVNNAGVLIANKIINMSDEQFSQIMSTNIESVYHLCRLCYPLLKASGGGNIVNVGSAAGGPRSPFISVPYITSKGALNQFTMCLSNEWAGENIRVNCVAPSLMATRLTQFATDNEEYMNQYLAEVPMKRLTQPEDAAKAIKFFSTDDSSFVTGQVLYVDGGYSVRGLGY